MTSGSETTVIISYRIFFSNELSLYLGFQKTIFKITAKIIVKGRESTEYYDINSITVFIGNKRRKRYSNQ
jgi:hypothetical protein